MAIYYKATTTTNFFKIEYIKCYFATNSKGVNVPVKETGWAAASETPTHLMVQFSSSHGGAYVGTPGNTFWVDNVRLVY